MEGVLELVHKHACVARAGRAKMRATNGRTTEPKRHLGAETQATQTATALAEADTLFGPSQSGVGVAPLEYHSSRRRYTGVQSEGLLAMPEKPTSRLVRLRLPTIPWQ